jgi:hypothetical protein
MAIHIRPNEKVGLELSEEERQLVLGLFLDDELETPIRKTAAGQCVQMTLDDLDSLGGSVAAEANHEKNKKRQKQLDRIFTRIQLLFEKYTDEEEPKAVNLEDAKRAKVVAEQGRLIAEWVEEAIAVAGQLRIKSKLIGRFPLQEAERTFVSLLPSLSPKIKKKVIKQVADFTVAEVASITSAVTEGLSGAGPMQQLVLLMVAKKLMDCLKDRIASE